MKRSLFFVFILLSVFHPGLVGSSNVPTTLSAPRIVSVVQSSPADKFLEAARRVVERAESEEANELLQFALACSREVGISGGTLVFQDPKTGKECAFGLLQFKQGEGKLDSLWGVKVEKRPVAGAGELPILIIRDEGMNENLAGMAFLHEVGHILIQMIRKERKNEKIPPQELEAIDDLGLFLLQFDLMEKVGGKPYLNLLQEEIERVEPFYRKDNSVPEPNYALSREIGEQIFPAPSGRKVVTTLFWIDAVFRVIDKVYGNDDNKAEIKKLDFLLMARKNKLVF